MKVSGCTNLTILQCEKCSLEELILEDHRLLSSIELVIREPGDYKQVQRNLSRNHLNFIYLDPPYDQYDEQLNFVGYTKDGFTRDDQVRLKKMCDRLIEKGCYVMISNSKTPFIVDLYNDTTKYITYTINTVSARRNINSNAQKRGEVEEVLIVGKLGIEE